MGMTDDFEASLQVLRGFDTDISVEVHEIKVNLFPLFIRTRNRGRIIMKYHGLRIYNSI